MSNLPMPRPASTSQLVMDTPELSQGETGYTTPKESGAKALISNVFKVLGIVMSAVIQCALIGGGKILESAYIVFINNKLTRDVLKIANEGLPSQLLSFTVSLLAYSIFFVLGYSLASAGVAYNTYTSFNTVFSSFSLVNVSCGFIGWATLALPLLKGGDSEIVKSRKQIAALEMRKVSLENRLKAEGRKVKKD